MENRRSRDSFTRSLKRICQRIDSRRVFEMHYNLDLLPGTRYSRLRVNALWVAGSYARGAMHCGDLDLVVDIAAEEGTLPLTPTVSRSVIGRAPDARLYIGTPEDNTSRVAFPEAKLVWSPESPDWNAAIDAISVDLSATRFERRHDILPLRKEQVFDIGDDDIFDKIVDLLEQQVLSSEWVPVSNINVQPDAWSPAAADFLEHVRKWCGKKTQEVMPFVVEWFNNNNRCDLWRQEHDKKTRFKIGGAEVLVGRPYIDLHLLESLSYSAIAIVPHLSRRGPNGLWILSRGANHPLIQKLDNCQAYYLADGARPDIVEELDGCKSTHSLELFRQREQAVIRQKEIIEEHDVDFDIVKAGWSDLSFLISSVDIVEIDSVRYAITREGQFFDGTDKLATVEEIFSALTPLPEQ
jgi:hypothetical protein